MAGTLARRLLILASMKTSSVAVLALLALPLAGCLGQGVSPSQGAGDDSSSSTPTPGPTGTPDASTGLSTGHYNYNSTSAPANTCWAPSKNMPSLPMAMPMDLTVTATTVDVSATVMSAALSFSWALAGTDLSGAGESDASLASQGVDCTIHVKSTFTGTVTGKDAFGGTQHVEISTVSGTQCGLLVGTISPQQFDQMPCTLDLVGSGAK